ncbi:MAG: hypothetical protein KF836_04505 [Fimbriimonadaceae bacterium]|nr:hypothetical protein [Fimbriimonadaceae bacterium]
MSESYCRIDGVIARGANKAVIFRRGPSKYTQMLLWDLNTDIVTPGQWLKAKVHTRHALVSDDAKFVAYMAADYRYKSEKKNGFWPEHVRGDLYRWIAVSRPPYFTALGLWEAFLTINAKNNIKINSGLSASEVNLAHCVFKMDRNSILEKRGWTQVEEYSTKSSQKKGAFSKLFFSFMEPKQIPAFRYEKNLTSGKIVLREEYQKSCAEVFDASGTSILRITATGGHPLWIDIDNAGRLVFDDKGCLYAWANFPEDEPQLIADLNPNTFEEVSPPEWATKP